MKSYEVDSIAVLNGRKPVKMAVPNNCIHFKRSNTAYTFRDCDSFNQKNFYSCNTNDVDHQMNNCLDEVENLKSEFDARKVGFNCFVSMVSKFVFRNAELSSAVIPTVLPKLSPMVFLSAQKKKSSLCMKDRQMDQVQIGFNVKVQMLID